MSGGFHDRTELGRNTMTRSETLTELRAFQAGFAEYEEILSAGWKQADRKSGLRSSDFDDPRRSAARRLKAEC
jgi:hypothetical protein